MRFSRSVGPGKSFHLEFWSIECKPRWGSAYEQSVCPPIRMPVFSSRRWITPERRMENDRTSNSRRGRAGLERAQLELQIIELQLRLRALLE
jgi:hypothetical protein